MANEILCRYETHKPVLDARVKIDFVFAYADLDDDGNPTNDAIRRNGVKALGMTRKMASKDRAMGRGDAEITLDHDWWDKASEAERTALLDHELNHIQVKINQHGVISRDDLGRPQLIMRKHDVDIGWFKIVAERNGEASLERIQARAIMDASGQYFWPEIVKQ